MFVSDTSQASLSPRATPTPVETCPTILVFDSGLGGLTVLREVGRVRPDARYVYVADDALFPYGSVDEGTLIRRVTELMSTLIAAHRPDLVIIACNTASTLVLPELRSRFGVPFVGTVPAIKPACASSKTRRVSVLGTEATVKREYTRALIRQYAGGCAVHLVGSARLAEMAEAALNGSPPDDREIAAEIAPCFIADRDGRTDTVVLACTHYPLLRDRFERLAPWPVAWIDPADAISRRVVALIGAAGPASPTVPNEVFFTSGRSLSEPLADALRTFGLTGPISATGCLTG